jgi:hypothetical protein
MSDVDLERFSYWLKLETTFLNLPEERENDGRE